VCENGEVKNNQQFRGFSVGAPFGFSHPFQLLNHAAIKLRPIPDLLPVGTWAIPVFSNALPFRMSKCTRRAILRIGKVNLEVGEVERVRVKKTNAADRCFRPGVNCMEI
jgi:hypothetical protein